MVELNKKKCFKKNAPNTHHLTYIFLCFKFTCVFIGLVINKKKLNFILNLDLEELRNLHSDEKVPYLTQISFE